MITDYFEAGKAITARLKGALTEVPSDCFFTPSSLADMLEISQPSLAIHVLYWRDVVTRATVGRGEKNKIDQQWTVILAVRNPGAQLGDTTEIQDEAGLLIPKLLTALQGWQPTEWMQPLGRVPSLPAGYSSAFAYYPFTFEGRISL